VCWQGLKRIFETDENEYSKIYDVSQYNEGFNIIANKLTSISKFNI